jgi:hypothetical protein
MREANHKYLPQEEGESSEIYANRLSRSVLYGAYSRTIKTLAGMPFMMPMDVKEMPPELAYLIKDATGEGVTLSAFAKELLLDLINYGICHILVEHPESKEELSLAEEKALNMRPYFSRIDPLKLIGWKSTKIGAKTLLTQARIFEDTTIDDPNDPFAEVPTQQVRVVENGVTTLYRKDISGAPGSEFRIIDTIFTDLDNIGIHTIYGNRTGFMQGAPVLEELAWLNIRHWQKVSDLDNIEHVANVPMAYALGVLDGEMENIIFSPHTMIKSGNQDLKLGYVEHSGHAITASQHSVDQLENRMVAMGAEMLSARGSSTRETGIAKTIDNSKATSVLQELVEKLEDGIAQAINTAGQWLDIKADTQVTIGDKISLTVDPNLVTNFLDMARNEEMDFEDLAKELQKRGLLSDSTKLKKGKPPELKAAVPPAPPTK